MSICCLPEMIISSGAYFNNTVTICRQHGVLPSSLRFELNDAEASDVFSWTICRPLQTLFDRQKMFELKWSHSRRSGSCGRRVAPQVSEATAPKKKTFSRASDPDRRCLIDDVCINVNQGLHLTSQTNRLRCPELAAIEIASRMKWTNLIERN